MDARNASEVTYADRTLAILSQRMMNFFPGTIVAQNPVNNLNTVIEHIRVPDLKIQCRTQVDQNEYAGYISSSRFTH
jgi:hypothetical protein